MIIDQNALDAWMAANGWIHWNPSGNAKPLEKATPWINSNSTSGELRDVYITCIYLNNPDKQLVCPLPRTIITNSQGALSNSDLGY